MFISSFEKIALPINIFKGRRRIGVSPQALKSPAPAAPVAAIKPAVNAGVEAAKDVINAERRSQRLAEATAHVTDPFTWRRALRQKA